MTTPVESGIASADRSGFRRALGEYATGVAVVTTSVDGVSYGLTSNSFASVSLDPPLVLWSLRRESQSFAAFERCEHFAINVLADHQIEMSARFAKSGPNKFDDVTYALGLGGAPLFQEVAATFECLRGDAFQGGDHLIVLGEVQAFRRYERSPLVFCKGRYAIVKDHPNVTMDAGRPTGRPSTP